MREIHARRALAAGAVVIALTRLSRADSQALALDYDADATCPDQATFSALVLEKLAANGVEESNGTRPQIAAHIHAASSGFVGQLALRRSDGSSYDREVTGASCAEVANALAFVLALALGAQDRTTPSVESAAPAVAAPPAAPPPVPALVPLAVTASASAPPPPVTERPSLWRLGASAQFGERAGLGAPTLALVGSALLEAHRIAVSPFGFTFRVGFSSANIATRSDANGSADLSWWAGRLEACPLRLRAFDRLALLPCVAADIGRQQVNGSPRSGPGSRTGTASKPWLDGLTALRLELSLTRWLSVELQGELIAPFTRYRFAFNPDTLVYRAPGAATAAFAGLAAHFP